MSTDGNSHAKQKADVIIFPGLKITFKMTTIEAIGHEICSVILSS